jgi:nitric oxide reductase subunit B
MWYARSPEVVHSTFMETMVWLRVPGDVVFSVGVAFLALFMWRLVFQARTARREAAAGLAAAK